KERRPMRSHRLIRWSGLASILSGVLFALFFLLHPGGGDPASANAVLTSPYAVEHTLGVSAMVLMLFGLIGLYVRQMAASARLGLIGFVVAFIGTALLVGVVFFDAYFVPIIAVRAPALLDATSPFNTLPGVLAQALPGIIWGLGFLILGAATLRARVLPRTGT